MIKTCVTAILLMLCGVVNAVAIDSLEITGGSFLMGFGDTLTPGAHADITIGGYDGSVPAVVGDAASYLPTSIVAFTFFGAGVAVTTAETDGVTSGYAPVTGDITGGNLSLDLSSWTAFWNGTSFNQGSSSDLVAGSECAAANCTTAITTTYDEMTGEFTASWDAIVVSGAFGGQLASWTIEGNVSAVPVPAAVWLFGSGLVGLAAVARRRKAA